MALFFNTKFECRSADADNGNIVITVDGEGGVSPDWEVRVEIIGPSGETVRSKPVAADATLNDADSGVSVLTYPIPIAGDGNYRPGTYEIRFHITNVGLASEIMFSDKYLFEPIVAPDNLSSTLIALKTSLNCLNGNLVVTDETDYGAWTLDSRSIKIVHPSIPGVATPADTTDTDTEVDVTVTHINVTYVGQLIVTVHKQDASATSIGGGHTNQMFQYHTANLSEDVLVTCDNNLCQVLGCLEDKFAHLASEACSAGGWGNLSAYKRSNFEYVMHLLNLAKLFQSCGNSDKFKEYLGKAQTELNCDCGCDDTTTVKAFSAVV